MHNPFLSVTDLQARAAETVPVEFPDDVATVNVADRIMSSVQEIHENMDIWVLIPLAAIIVWGITEVAKYYSKRVDRLGATSDELTQALSKIGGQLERLEENEKTSQRRLQNLEAIVTSQVWDLLHDESQSMEERKAAVAGSGLLKAAEGFDPESDAGEVEQLAKRLRS